MRNKRILAFLLALVMSFSVSVLAYAAEDGQTVVTILHTNDVHGRFVAGDGIIGIANVAAVKAATENAILVDAGDAIHGLPFTTINKGADAAKLMAMAGYDVWVPGNHDFNYGYERLLELAQLYDLELISSNIKKDGVFLLDTSAILEAGGVRIGFVGATTRETTYKTAADNTKGLTFEDPIANVKMQVEFLKNVEAVDVVVVIAHLGTDETSEDTSTALAEAIPEIDVIIDGHSHTLFTEGHTVNGVLIASAGNHSDHLGAVAITLDADKNVVGIEATVQDAEAIAAAYTPDAAVETLVNEIAAEQDSRLGDVIGSVPSALSADRSPGVRTQEMPLGNLVADAILTQTGADIAFTNGGGLRETIPAGDVTKKNIIACLPFGNFAVTKYVTPAILKSLMENGVSKLPEADGRFPQIAGFSFTYDLNMPEGSRVTSITYQGSQLDLADTTTQLLLATNDFIANQSGDGYTALSFIDTAAEYGAMDELVINYIQTMTTKYDEVEGRITEAALQVPAAVIEEPAVVEEPEAEPEETVAVVVSEIVVEPVQPAPVPVPVPVVIETGSKFPIGTTAVVDNCYFLNVRKGHGPQHDAFTYISKGDVITVLDYQYNWILINTAKGEGWVYEGYLTR